MMKNECGKTRDVENPYETWVNDRAGFEWRVLKKSAPRQGSGKPIRTLVGCGKITIHVRVLGVR